MGRDQYYHYGVIDHPKRGIGGRGAIVIARDPRLVVGHWVPSRGWRCGSSFFSPPAAVSSYLPRPATLLPSDPFSLPPILFFRSNSFLSLPPLRFDSGPSSTPLGDARGQGQTRGQETQAGPRLPILVHSDCLPSFRYGSFASRGVGMERI